MTEPASRVVARNIRRLRKARGWFQDDVRKRMAEHGFDYSKATYSAIERSEARERMRAFSAEEIRAFALTFNVPIDELFKPRPRYDRCPRCGGTGLVDLGMPS